MLSLYYNVKDATFAAQGDGVCDDRVAIKCAIDACAAAGGGTVFFPRGTYLCGNDGADPANPCSFLLDNVDNVRLLGCGMGGTVLKQSGSAGSGAFDLFRITGGSEATEFEGITFDQSGLTSPGTNQCHMINILEANIVKVIDCKFTGGVGNAGSYVHMGGSLGDTCSLIYVADCDMRDAGGPAIWIDGEVNTVWITENTLIQTGSESDVIYVNDSIGSTIQDLKILNNKSTSATGYAVRLISSDVLARVMVSANILLGFVVLDGVTKGQFQNNQVYGSVAGVAEPVLLVSNTTHVQVQNNIVSRASTCDSGLVCELDTCDRTQVQKNQWIQEVAETSIFHAVDCDTLQLSSNTVRNTDAGSATTVAYLIEAAASAIDNIQIVGEHITSDAGAWLYAVHVKSNSETIGVVQINLVYLPTATTGSISTRTAGAQVSLFSRTTS